MEKGKYGYLPFSSVYGFIWCPQWHRKEEASAALCSLPCCQAGVFGAGKSFTPTQVFPLKCLFLGCCRAGLDQQCLQPECLPVAGPPACRGRDFHHLEPVVPPAEGLCHQTLSCQRVQSNIPTRVMLYALLRGAWGV